MKLHFLLAACPLLLFSFRLENVTSNPSPAVLPTPSLDVVNDEEGASSSREELQQQKPVQDLPWISIYTPLRSCHTHLTEKHGEFSLPSFPNGFEGNIWCNWTVWAGVRKHIVIYIKGFRSRESCDVNTDKIFFHGVSSLAENAVVYACGRKEVHVFATYARGVHIVLLMRRSAHPRKERLVGKYFIFKHRDTKPPLKDLLGPAEMLVPELPHSIFPGLPQSVKETFALMWGRTNASLSISQRTGKVTELGKSSQARTEDGSVVDLPNFVGQVASTERLPNFVWQIANTRRLMSKSPGLLSASIMMSAFPFPSEIVTEMRGGTSWGHSDESTTFSYVPYLSSSPPIAKSGPPEGTASLSWGPLIKNDPQMGSELMQLDYHATDPYSLALSYGLEATSEVNNEAVHSYILREVIPTIFQTSTSVHEVGSGDSPSFESALRFSPGQNWMGTELQEYSLLLPSDTTGGNKSGWPSSSSGTTFSGDTSEWERSIFPTPKETAMLGDPRPILESAGEVTDPLKILLDIPVPSTPPSGRLHLRTSSSYQEASGNELPVATEFVTSADVSYNVATKTPGESGKINQAEKSHPVLDLTTGLPFSLNEATMAPVFSAAPGLSTFSQDCDLFLRIKATVPFPAMEREPSLPRSSEEIPSFFIPDLEPSFSAVDSALYPSMGFTDPSPSVEPGPTLSLPELKSLVLAETSLAFSSAVGDAGPIPSGPECASSDPAAVLEMAVDTVFAPSAVLLLAVTPTATVNSLVTEQTVSAFSPLHEITPSLDLLAANTDKKAISCCWLGVSPSKQEALPFLTVPSSRWVDPVVGALSHSISVAPVTQELEHFPPTPKMSPAKQQLSEGGKDDGFITAPEEKNQWSFSADMVQSLNSVSRGEPLASLVTFAGERQSPEMEAVTKTPLASLSLTGEEKGAINSAFISSTVLASVLSPTETQTPATFPVTVKLVDEATGAALRPWAFWEMQPHAEWQRAALDIAVAGIQVPETLVEGPPQRNNARLQTPLAPPDVESQVASEGLQNKIELGSPWLMVYIPVKSCHVTLKDKAGTFSPPAFISLQTNNWCNWTIWAGPRKHILIYIEGFEGKPDCEENQDKILFQGVVSSVENKVAYACRNHRTLIFATQAVAAHVVFLSKASSPNHGQKDFKGRYYIFEDYEMLTSATRDVVPREPPLKSNSSVELPPNSYIIHSRRISDFEKVGQILSKEYRLPAAGKDKWGNSNNPSSLGTLLRPTDDTPVSILKFTKDVSLRGHGLKKMQTVEPPADEYRAGKDVHSGNPKKADVLSSDGLENKDKASPKLVTELVAAGIARESTGLKNKGHVSVSRRPTYVKDARRAKFEKPSFHSGLTSPQVLQEQTLPASPHKNIPEVEQKSVLWPAQSRAEIADKASDEVSDDTEFQRVERKETARGERMDSPVPRGGNGDQDMAVADAVGGNGPLRGIEMKTANNSTTTTKSSLTTRAHPNGFKVLPTLKSVQRDIGGLTISSPGQVALPGNVKNTQVETVVPLHPEDSVTRDPGCSQRKCTKSNPPDFQLSEEGSSDRTLLKEGHINNSHGSIWVFRSPENDSLLDSQHRPGDVLLEVTFGIEHQGWIPHDGSELVGKDLIESMKMQVHERVKFLSNKVKEIKLKEIRRKEGSERKRTSDPNLIFTFWLHLEPEDKNISRLIHSQLEGLGGTSTGSGEIRQVSVGDVNECGSGIELCGEEAVCLNGYGTYLCQCKEEYEDQSSTKSGTLCVRSPPSGLRLLYSYMEIFVGSVIFFICAIVVLVSVLCTVVKKRRRKKDLSSPEMALSSIPAVPNSQATAFDQDNLHNLLTLDPACLKLRAKSPEWPLPLRRSPTETCRVSVEQSECL